MASALAKSAEASPHANSDPPQWLHLERWIDLLVSEDDDIGDLQAGEFFDVASRALVCEQDRRPTRLDIRAYLGADRVEDLARDIRREREVTPAITDTNRRGDHLLDLAIHEVDHQVTLSPRVLVRDVTAQASAHFLRERERIFDAARTLGKNLEDLWQLPE